MLYYIGGLVVAFGAGAALHAYVRRDLIEAGKDFQLFLNDHLHRMGLAAHKEAKLAKSELAQIISETEARFWKYLTRHI